MAVDINELLLLEAELKTSRERETLPISLDAKLNILKYLQVQTGLRSIAPVRSKGLFQSKVLDVQDCGEDEKLEPQLQFSLAEADLAKPRLDELVAKVAQDSSKYEVQCVDVKSRESTQRKASRFWDGGVRKVADMARVTVICATPEALEEVYLAIIMALPKASRTCRFPVNPQYWNRAVLIMCCLS
ncbi:unnamed protein product [Ectocarpus sp. CCAP 1310/34]|nr:unnamed protein product [Ectocarpus sp. CCAP 1310/34]